jgi:regulator of protease activity HflC (stomatin/prohibitin superfamily)
MLFLNIDPVVGVVIILLVLILILIASSIKIVPQANAYVVE